MQNTRLSTLFDRFTGRFVRFLRNPWRRLSVLMISVLGGNFLATTISTVTGQRGRFDVIMSLILVIITEIINWVVYSSDQRRDFTTEQRPLLLEIFNATKIGLTYGLFVEAFKLGS